MSRKLLYLLVASTAFSAALSIGLLQGLAASAPVARAEGNCGVIGGVETVVYTATYSCEVSSTTTSDVVIIPSSLLLSSVDCLGELDGFVYLHLKVETCESCDLTSITIEGFQPNGHGGWTRVYGPVHPDSGGDFLSDCFETCATWPTRWVITSPCPLRKLTISVGCCYDCPALSC